MCSSLFNDPNWEFIRDWLEKSGIEVQEFLSMNEGGVNQLKKLVSELQEEAKEREAEKKRKEAEKKEDGEPTLHELIQYLYHRDQYVAKEVERAKQLPKYQSPKYILVCDDLAEDVRSKSYATLVKHARHFCIRTICSSQKWMDLYPDSREQIRVWLLFKGLSEKHLKMIHDQINLKMPLDVFLDMYYQATEVEDSKYPKPFLYLAPRFKDYRINFDYSFDLPKKYV